MPSTKSYVNSDGMLVIRSSAVRKNLNAAASSTKPMTTLTVFIHEPLFGSFLRKLGKIARTKNGAAKVVEKARPPKNNSHQPKPDPAAMPANPPRNGATQVKPIIVNVM